MLAVLRYRPLQAVVLLLLAALVTTTVVFAPMYNRALQQSMVKVALTDADSGTSGIEVISYLAGFPERVLTPEELDALLPASVRRYYEPAIEQSTVGIALYPRPRGVSGRMMWRDAMCTHVRFVTGACPTATGQVAVSDADARTRGWRVGSTIVVRESDDTINDAAAAARVVVTVVGTYAQVDGPYWFQDVLGGRSPTGQLDTFLTARETFTAPTLANPLAAQGWSVPHNGVDYLIVPGRVGIDEIRRLGPDVQSFVEAPWAALGTEAASRQVPPVFAATGITDLATSAAAGRDQANVTVPLLMAQLALLLLCVLWLVLVAATEQRRTEVAMARLRGRGPAGARRVLLAETLPPVALGVAVGVAAAFGLSWLARHVWLPAQPPFELLAPTALATGVVAVVALALTLASVRRTSSEPVASLLRSIAARRSGLALGVVEAMLVAAAVAAFVALATGGVSGPLALAAPTLLAVAVGVVVGRVAAPVAAALGRALLRRGRLAVGAALLQASRRPATRWIVPVVTIAMCLLVFAASALSVGARNRDYRAEVETGAPVVLTTDAQDVGVLRGALLAADPSGLAATPVVLVSPPNNAASTTVAVLPRAFTRIAQWAGHQADDFAWQRITPTVAPVRFTGRDLTLDLTSTPLQPTVDATDDADAVPGSAAPQTGPVTLGLWLVGEDGKQVTIPVATLPVAGLSSRPVRADLPCDAGCQLVGLTLTTDPGQAAEHGRVTLRGAAVDGTALRWGAASSWTPVTGRSTITPEGAGPDLVLTVDNGGLPSTSITHAAVPTTLPALATDLARQGSDRTSGQFLDGSAADLAVTGDIPFVPGAPPRATVVDLDAASTRGWNSGGSSVAKVYLASDSPALRRSVTAALQAEKIQVTEAATTAAATAAYTHTAASWSLQLALVVGAISVLIAVLALLVLTATAWRGRSRDYAGLRLAGVPARSVGAMSVGENVPVVAVSAVLGAMCGLVAAHTAMPMIPLFPTPPAAGILDLTVAWRVALAAGAAAALVLLVTAYLASRWVARRSALTRLQESG